MREGRAGRVVMEPVSHVERVGGRARRVVMEPVSHMEGSRRIAIETVCHIEDLGVELGGLR